MFMYMCIYIHIGPLPFAFEPNTDNKTLKIVDFEPASILRVLSPVQITTAQFNSIQFNSTQLGNRHILNQ